MSHRRSNNDYFARLNFSQQEELSLLENFNALCLTQNWKHGSKAYRNNKNKCYEAAVRGTYGANNKLDGWQDLCRDLRIEPVPPSIKQCKKAVSKAHVNIFDFIDARNAGTEPKVYKSVEQLKHYSMNSGKIFPKKLVKENAYLKALLRQML